MQFKGARQRTDALYELGIFVAWHVAKYSKAEKMPSLQAEIDRFRRNSGKKRKVEAHPMAVLQSVAAKTGTAIQFRPRKKL